MSPDQVTSPFDNIRSRIEADPNFIVGVQTPDDVERVALQVLDSTSEGNELYKRITEARDKGIEDNQSIRQRSKLFRAISVEISLMTGVEIEAAEHEAQKAIYKNGIQSLISSIVPNSSDEDIMQTLGMIRPVAGAKGHVFTFPSKVFPPYIKEQWGAYVGMIEQFDDAGRKRRQGIITQEEFDSIDLLRKRAHDTVSSSVGEILEFPEWELENYRTLVGKMRDEKFAEPKGEMAVYAQFLRERIPVPEHLTVISRKLGRTGLHKAS